MMRASAQPEQLRELCRRHRIRNLRILGSAARGDITPTSDIDILLEFEHDVDPDLFELGGMRRDLSDLLRRTADLKAHGMFSPGNLRRVLDSSVMGHAA
jgi:uncharacterized protein